jgi:hypothetical protein
MGWNDYMSFGTLHGKHEEAAMFSDLKEYIIVRDDGTL